MMTPQPLRQLLEMRAMSGGCQGMVLSRQLRHWRRHAIRLQRLHGGLCGGVQMQQRQGAYAKTNGGHAIRPIPAIFCVAGSAIAARVLQPVAPWWPAPSLVVLRCICASLFSSKARASASRPSASFLDLVLSRFRSGQFGLVLGLFPCSLGVTSRASWPATAWCFWTGVIPLVGDFRLLDGDIVLHQPCIGLRGATHGGKEAAPTVATMAVNTGSCWC